MSAGISLFKLFPSVIEKVWGGERLAKLKNVTNSGLIGETWEVSTIQGSESKIGDQDLSVVLGEELPYLIKFIDTSDNLSVQVHPGDEYAKKHENSLGKTECWMILEAEEGSGIYLGFKDGVTQADFKKALKKNEDMSEFLQFYEVKRGDFFFVPAGTVHAIGKGVLLAEVQQSSGVTYRVWDWNRMDTDGKPRELHVDKAMDVLNFGDELNEPERFMVNKKAFEDYGEEKLIEHQNFCLKAFKCDGGDRKVIDARDLKRPMSIVSLKGELTVKRGDEDMILNPYEAMIVTPNSHDVVEVTSALNYEFFRVW